MKILFFILFLPFMSYAQNVLMITDTSKLKDIIYQNGNRMILPVNDGAGNLILGLEVLEDPAFAKIKDVIISCTKESEYIPFPETEEESIIKYEELRQEGKLISIDQVDGKVSYGEKEYEVVKEAEPVKDGEVKEGDKPKRQ